MPAAKTSPPKPTTWLIWFGGIVAFCAMLHWRAPLIWFRADDFAWLLHSRLTPELGWFDSLFAPAAQGTIRVFSERLYFWLLDTLFGVTTWPFRAVALATFAAILWLIQAIGTRLTGHRAAGLLAALFWGVSGNLFTPIVWASAYNELLLAALLLGAFYARLQWLDTGEPRWRWMEAALYLVGFGALELVVVYPAIVLLHALTDQRARARISASLWMWVPAIAFALMHLFVIPKVDDPTYRLTFDVRLFETLTTYLSWTTGPNWYNLRDAAFVLDTLPLRALVAASTWIIAAALAGFGLWRLGRRETLPLLFAGWFVLWLAPVLPLPNHLTEYYLTIPSIGLAWLAGWAVNSAARLGQSTPRYAACTAAAVLATLYVAGSFAQLDALGAFHQQMTGRMRLLYRATEAELLQYPGSALVFLGINDETWFRAGFGRTPLRLAGTDRAYLAPQAREVEAFSTYDGIPAFRSSPSQLLELMGTSELRALEFDGRAMRDVTSAYAPVLRAQLAGELLRPINVGQQEWTKVLGEGWYAIENSTRWSARRAALHMNLQPGVERLTITGFAPQSALDARTDNQPIEVRVTLNGREAGTGQIDQFGTFSLDLDVSDAAAEILSATASNQVTEVEVALDLSHSFQPPGDARELGLIFGTFQLH